MLGINDQFELILKMTESDFSSKIISMTDSEKNEYLNPTKEIISPFSGSLKFNKFKLRPNPKLFKLTYGQIEGEFKFKNEQLFVKGKVVNYELHLIFIMIFVLFSISLLTYRLLFNYTSTGEEIFIGLFCILELILLGVLFKNINKLKTFFLEKLAMFQEE